MPVRPADLVEAWHLVVADGAEPVEWSLPHPLWIEVRREANERGSDAFGDDCLLVEDDRTLLGTPVTIADNDELAPVLRVVRGGERESVPIIGSVDEA